MSRSFKRVLALLMVVVMLVGLLPTIAFAEETAPATEVEDTRSFGKRMPERYTQTRSLQPKTSTPDSPKTALPATYNSNTLGYITPIRNQGNYGTCWAHGALASCEAYMIKHGVRVGNGGAATTSLNLSESHLSWFGYTDAYDKLGLLAGDKSTPADDYRDLGGFGEIPTYTLMRWEGLASESTSGLAYSSIPAPSKGLSSSLAYQVNVAHVQDCVWIPTSDRTAVKEAIMEYGAGTFGYYADDGTHETFAGAYYYPSSESSNHDVTVVGWDDNYSRNNFAAAARPSSDGAWIIKNSWGTGYGTSGYYFISYEDVPSNNDTCYFYKVEPVDNYDNNYQYDGTSNFVNYYTLNKNASVANVFTARGTESLEAVAFCNWDAGMSYTCNIYKNPTKDNPSSGTLVSTVSGTFEYAGYHTVPLTTPVSLSAGDTFAVVFTNAGSSSTTIPLDKTGSQTGWVSWTHASPSDVSYYKSATGSWNDMSSTQNYRIKAYTVDSKFTVTATSNNNSFGTVSVSGRTITATPANGYYVASANVTSGTATTTINGNIITVDASSDCTIQVVFAAKAPVTITFHCDYDTVNPISTFTGDTFAFPSAICNVPGYTFVGWCATTLSGASEATYFAPATTATATGDATYYALFSYSDGSGTGTGEWMLLENASSLTTGMKVVIASNEKGFTAGNISNYVMTNIATTFSADDSTITDLGTGTVVLTVGGTSGAWTFANEDGNLLGATAVKKIAFGSGSTTWDVTISEGAATIQNSESSYGRFLYNVNSPRFAPYTSAANASMLLPQLYYMDGTAGSTFYTTTPNTCEHSWEEIDRLDASCTEAGTVLSCCSLCGTEKYEDIPALGHDYGASTSNNNGTHSKTCSRCSDVVTEDCSYTTSTNDTTVTYTCSVCAYSYSVTVDSYTVTYNDCGSISSVSCLDGNSVTLPTTGACTDESYTFAGWVTAEIDPESATAPTILTDTYTPTGNVTLFALYTRTDGAGGSSGLVKMQAGDTLANGDQIVIVANGTTVALYQETVNSSYVNKYTFDNNIETILADDKNYLTVNTVSGGFTLGDAANGYLSSSSNNLYVRSSVQTWTLLDLEDGTFKLQSGGRNLSYRSDLSNQYWRMGGASYGTSGKTVLDIYKVGGVGSTTYYTTSPVSIQPCTHANMETVAEVAATCTTAGSNLYYHCPDCGKYFKDVAGETQTTVAAEIVAALGHAYSETATQLDETNHKYQCSRCDDYTTEAHTFTTTTEGTTATHLCEACGFSYTTQLDSFTVTYSDCGSSTTATCLEGQSVTLPTGSAVEGYTFAGWVTAEINPEDTKAPAILTDTYTPTEDVTLYALYTRTEAGTGTGIPTAPFAVGDTGDYVIAALDNGTYYALPNNPTLTSGKITGQVITVSENNGIVYVSDTAADGYVWSLAKNGNNYTLSDGTKYIYHTNGGNSGTFLSYGTSTSINWNIFTRESGDIMFGGSTSTSRGILYRSGYGFGGYALSNLGTSGYCNIVLLPVGGSGSGDTTYYTTAPDVETEPPVEELELISAAPILDDKIDMVYNAKVPEGYSNPYVVFTFNGVETTVTEYTPDSNGNLNFVFNGINPQCMGDNIGATLYATKENVTESVSITNYSIRYYCVNMLAKEDVTGELRTLLSDLLAYGAAAQTYMNYKTDALVNTGSDISNPTYSTFSNLSGLGVSFNGTADDSYRWISAGLTLTNSVAMNFHFYAESIDGLTVDISINGRTQSFTQFTEIGNGIYEISFTGISATEFGDNVTASFTKNGTPIGNTVSYSVNAYICAKQEDTNESLQALVKALYNYGAAAAAYAE